MGNMFEYQLIKQMKQHHTIYCATVLQGHYAGQKCIWTDTNMICDDGCQSFWEQYQEVLKYQPIGIVQIQTTCFFVELLTDAPKLILLGGGHVSQAVCEVGKLLEFDVTVVDDRPEFVTKERFPKADKRICESYEQVFSKLSDESNCYYVVLTRGHLGDEICVSQILKRNFFYLGMIGSHNKVEKTKENLLRQGFSKQEIHQIHAPIGLRIGGQTPAEIAISIAAEIVQQKNRVQAIPFDVSIQRALQTQTGWKIMTTIIDKKGSSPRGVGSKMLVTQQRIYGSIGGGAIEYEVIQTARKQPDLLVRSYQLSDADSAYLGMICGGSVKVLFERVEEKPN